MPMKQIGLGLLGLGTVGTGLCKLVMENKELIEKRMGISLRAQNPGAGSESRADPCPRGQLTTDPNEILKGPQFRLWLR